MLSPLPPMAPPPNPPPTRRPTEAQTAAGFGIPMAQPLGRNLFPGWPPAGGVFQWGFEAEEGGGGQGSDGLGGGSVRSSSAAAGFSGVESSGEAGTMNGGGSFMDLMFNDTDQIGQNISSSPPEDQNLSQTDRNAFQAKPSQKRSKNFSEEEDTLLVSAWLNVSLDAVNGADQSKSTYWGRITEYFHANKTFESNCTQGSLSNRWSGIQLDVNKFAGCVSRIDDRNQSGQTIQDKQMQALCLFKAEDKDHRSFPYLHCYEILKHEPKWIERRRQLAGQQSSKKKQKASASTSHVLSESPINVDDSDDGSQKNGTPTQERPTGRKKEKDKLRQNGRLEALDHAWEKKKAADAKIEAMKQAKKEERTNKTLKLEEERIALEKDKFEVTKKQEDDRIALEKEKLEVTKKQEDDRLALEKSKFELSKMLEERIMNLDISGMCSPQQEFYKKLKQRFLSQT